jgi:threonine synthase
MVTAIRVSEDEINQARLDLAPQDRRLCRAFFCSDPGGLYKAKKRLIQDNEQVVLLITGHGLKDIAGF